MAAAADEISWLPPIFEMRVSADGSRVLTSGLDATIRLGDAETGAEVWSARPGPGRIDWADLSADGRRVLWTNGPGTRLFKVRERREA